MTTNTPSLADLSAFATIARHRSFTRAAAELGVSRSALSHTTRALEARLNLRLLNRTTRSVSPTEAGEELLRKLDPLLSGFAAVFDNLTESAGTPAGTLRINAPENAAQLLLAEIVPAFLERHPRMSIDIAADGRLIDIVAEGFDAGIRLAEAVPQDMITVPFGGPVRFLPVASPDYLAHHPAPNVPADLSQHHCIRHRFPGGTVYSWEFYRHGQTVMFAATGRLTLNQTALMVEAAKAGQGIAYVPEPAARVDFDAGTLVPLLADWCPPFPGLCLYYSGHRHVPQGLRAFIDLIQERLPKNGRQP